MADFLLHTSALLGGWQAEGGSVAISAVTVAELQFGLLAATDPAVRARRLNALRQVERIYRAHAFTAETAMHYGELSAAVKALGRNPRPRTLDLQIAATAKEHGLTLVTANVDDLGGVEHLLAIRAL